MNGHSGSPPAVNDRARKQLAMVLLGAAVLVAAYWAAWFWHRPLVAAETRPAYVQFEDAFPLADAWLALCLVAGAVGLLRRSGRTLLWLLAGVGAGGYLGAMDVLYDLEHGIWGRGANGLVELAVNLLTLGLTVGVGRWAWRRRADLGGAGPV